MKRRKQFEPLQPPGIPTFTLTAGNAQIVIATVVPGAGGTPTSYQYEIRRRNNANTRWANTQGPFPIGAIPHTITEFRSGTAIANGRRHQVRLRAVNHAGTSAFSGWQEVTPAA